ncbi:MAG: biotin transporter BioY [Clostridiaceae bacterium]|nr:biotin transporter BioY [Clostridiaceae bacterium]
MRIRQMLSISIGTAILAVCSQISIPLFFTPVPITLQTFAIILISIILGKPGVISVLIYTLLGALGAPVFANFSGGFNSIAGPSGGYILGFILMSMIISSYNHQKKNIFLFIIAYIGLIIDYLFGTIQLKIYTGLSFYEAIAAGVLPFIIKDIIITSITVPLSLKIKKLIPYSISNSIKTN